MRVLTWRAGRIGRLGAAGGPSIAGCLLAGRRLGLGVGSAALLLAAACGRPAANDPVALRAILEDGQARLQSIAVPPGPVTAPVPAARSLPRPLPVTAGPPPGTASALIGASPEALRARLGEPSLRRVEGEAEIWLYPGPGCALDLVLYPGPQGLAVAQAAARATGTAALTEAACLAGLGTPASPPPPRAAIDPGTPRRG